MVYSLYEMLALFFIYAFLGWCAEVVYTAVSKGRFVNRGFLNGPVCPIYGVGVLFILSFFHPLREDWFFLLVGSTVVATVLEYLANRMLEHWVGTKWWDYSGYRFNFGGYVCLNFSLFWGVGAVAIVKWVHPLIYFLLGLVPTLLGQILVGTAVLLLGLDLAASLAAVHGMHHSAAAPESVSARTGRMLGRWGDRLCAHIQRRMEQVVPHLSPEQLADQWRSQREAHQGVFAYGVGFYKLVWLFGIGALLGDLTETVYCYLTAGVLMSRSSVLYGPFSIVWGLGAVLMTVLLERLRHRDDRYVFLSGMVLGGAYEYVCSVFTELAFGTVFWDYSHFAFNLGGRINLLYCFFWGIAAVVWIKVIYPFLSDRIERIPSRVGKPITWLFVLFMSVNILLSGMALARYAQRQLDLPAQETAVTAFLDRHYPDERMRRIYPNAVFTGTEQKTNP